MQTLCSWISQNKQVPSGKYHFWIWTAIHNTIKILLLPPSHTFLSHYAYLNSYCTYSFIQLFIYSCSEISHIWLLCRETMWGDKLALGLLWTVTAWIQTHDPYIWFWCFYQLSLLPQFPTASVEWKTNISQLSRNLHYCPEFSQLSRIIEDISHSVSSAENTGFIPYHNFLLWEVFAR